MKRLIVVRHGDYDTSSSQLTALGLEQIHSLTKRLKLIVSDSTVRIFSSPALRAHESALIIGNVLNVSVEIHSALLSYNLSHVFEIIMLHESILETLILVAHHEHADYFPLYFAQHALQTTLNACHIERGGAAVLDCQNKTLTTLSPYSL